MKKCPYCRTANANEAIYCEACYSPLKNAKIIDINTEDFPRPKKKPRLRKEPERVKLYHGPWVKKSTAKYLARKNQETMQWVLGFFVIIALLGILSQCS